MQREHDELAATLAQLERGVCICVFSACLSVADCKVAELEGVESETSHLSADLAEAERSLATVRSSCG